MLLSLLYRRGSRSRGYRCCPRSTFGHQPGFSWFAVSSCMPCITWTQRFFSLSWKFCLQIMQCENSPTMEELFGVSLNEWYQVCGYCWLFRIYLFFQPFLVLCRQSGWDFAEQYRWPLRRFLAVLALVPVFLFPFSPCKASENVVVFCFVSRNHSFPLILLFQCF